MSEKKNILSQKRKKDVADRPSESGEDVAIVSWLWWWRDAESWRERI